MKNVLSESFLHKKIPRAHKIDLEENMDRTITAPIDRETLKSLHAGDYVYISGTIYTARDAAHKRMIETLDEGRELPLDLKDNVIYYMGPSPAERAVRLVLQVRPQPAVWINILQDFWISAWEP